MANELVYEVPSIDTTPDDGGWQLLGDALHFKQPVLQLAKDSCFYSFGQWKSRSPTAHHSIGCGVCPGAVLHLFGHPHLGFLVLHLDHDSATVALRVDLLDLFRSLGGHILCLFGRGRKSLRTYWIGGGDFEWVWNTQSLLSGAEFWFLTRGFSETIRLHQHFLMVVKEWQLTKSFWNSSWKTLEAVFNQGPVFFAPAKLQSARASQVMASASWSSSAFWRSLPSWAGNNSPRFPRS